MSSRSTPIRSVLGMAACETSTSTSTGTASMPNSEHVPSLAARALPHAGPRLPERRARTVLSPPLSCKPPLVRRRSAMTHACHRKHDWCGAWQGVLASAVGGIGCVPHAQVPLRADPRMAGSNDVAAPRRVPTDRRPRTQCAAKANGLRRQRADSNGTVGSKRCALRHYPCVWMRHTSRVER
jgi:hypothetical protein